MSDNKKQHHSPIEEFIFNICGDKKDDENEDMINEDDEEEKQE